jgi:hypothetical protein
VVCAGQQAVPTPVCQTAGSANFQATALPSPFRRRLEELQRLADAGTAGGPHRRGNEVPEPGTPGLVGSADRTAVFDSEGIRSECGRKSAEWRTDSKSAANTGDFTIHIGYTPGYIRGPSGICPSGHGACEQEGRQSTLRSAATEDGKEEWRMQKAEGKGGFGSAASAEGYAIQMGALSEY